MTPMTVRRLGAAVSVALVGVIGCVARAADVEERAAPLNVLLITIDTLRADRIGAYGYKAAATPTLDRLAARGARFSDAIAHVPLTYPSHVALLTGRYPWTIGIKINGTPTMDSGVVTIAEEFAAQGFRTAAFVGSAILDGGLGLDQGFEVYDDDFAPPRGDDRVSMSDLQRPAAAVVTPAIMWIASQSARWFAWVHLYDPHLPYAAPGEFAKKSPGRPYDAEISYADAAVGRLLTSVDRERTAIVVTSDHGESLGEHGESDHGFFIYDATLKVPLIIAGGGIPPRTIAEQVRLIDVAPTLLALAGINAARSEGSGVSLVPLLNGETRRDPPVSLAESWYPRLHFGWSELRGARVGEFMYIAAPKPELYDLRADAAQRVNVIDRRGPVAARLATELTAAPRVVETATRSPDPETVRRLQALGYVGSFAPVTSGIGADPKDHVADYQRYRDLLNRALGSLERGRPAAAVPLLQQLVKLNVRAFEAHQYLGTAYAAADKHDAALGEFEVAVQLNPEGSTARLEMAKLLHRKGDTQRAIAEVQTVLAREPRSFYAWYTLGVINQQARRPLDAFRAFSEATRLNPRDPRAVANMADAALQSGQTVVAREQFERMIALGYRVAPAHFNLGLIAQRSGDRAAAERHFAQALTADPTFKPAKDALAKLR
jgi:choline-sulfatase